MGLQPPPLFLPQDVQVFRRDKAAPSRHGDDKAFPLQFLISAFGGDEADAQLLGQQPHGGQRFPLRQLSGYNCLFDLHHDLLINGHIAGVANYNVQGAILQTCLLYI